MKYAITGAAGFIGRHIVAECTRRGYKTVLIDLPGRLTAVERYLEELVPLGYEFGHSTHDLLEVRACDLLEAYNPEELLDGCDIAIHLAGMSNPRQAAQDPDMAKRINVGITERLLTGRRFVLASTQLIYGIRPVPFKASEDTPASDNLQAYEQSKLEAEKAVANQENHLICRFANNYGPGQDLGFLVPDVIQRVKDSKDSLGVYNPRATRDFIFVGDTVSGLFHLIEGGQKGIYNIGTGNGTSVGEVYDCIARQLGRDFRYSIISDEESFLVLDTRKINSLGWEPRIPLEEGIRLIVK